MKQKVLVSVLIIVIAFFGLSVINKEDHNCINLYIDYNVLDNKTKINKCIEFNKETTALSILEKANLKIEGTKKYGLAVVCRVNGLPDSTVDSCEDMPSAKAYWAIIIKEKQIFPLPTNEWGWGQLAINEQLLNPGDSLGLVWANNGEVVFP